MGRPPGDALLARLPAELLATVLSQIRLLELPAALLALQLVCKAWWASLQSADLWAALSSAAGLDQGATAHRGRRSARLERSAAREFAQSLAALRIRSEYLVHALASMAQESRDLSLGKVRRALATWAPCLLDRVSPVSNATALMEVCRARGCSEGAILAAVSELVLAHGAGAGVPNSEGQTPLIVAAARGLPRVVAFLLAHGADPLQRGFGRFRAMAAPGATAAPAGAGAGGAVVRGSLSPLEWTEAILARERARGVAPRAQRSLLQSADLLRAAVAKRGPQVAAASQSRAGASRIVDDINASIY